MSTPPVTTIPIALALRLLMRAWVPGDQNNEEVLAHLQFSSYSVDTSLLIKALLIESYDECAVAQHLWHRLLSPASPNDAQVLIDFFNVGTVNQHSLPITLSLKSNAKFSGIATFCRQSRPLQTIFSEWAKSWWMYLVLPIMGKSRTPSPPKTGPGSQIESAKRHQATLRKKLVDRDGIVSPISGYRDTEGRSDSDDLTGLLKAKLIVAHILPFSLNNKGTALSYLEIFSGGDILASSIEGEKINDMSNAFLVDTIQHDLYDRFSISVTADESTIPPTYRLVCLDDDVGSLCEDVRDKIRNRTPLAFGSKNPVGLPNPKYFNAHHAIGRVIRATGAAEIVASVLRDDKDSDEEMAHLGRGAEQDSVALSYLDEKLKELEGQGRAMMSERKELDV